MEQETINKIRQALEQATPGPWRGWAWPGKAGQGEERGIARQGKPAGVDAAPRQTTRKGTT